MEYIKFKELSKEEQDVQVKNATLTLLYKYINNYNKLCKAGLDPFEYFKLRGVPLTYDEVREKLINRELIIKIGKDNTFDVIDNKEFLK